MYEIEAKVPLKKEDVEKIKNKIRQVCKKCKKTVQKDDIYYGNQRAHFRLRKTKSKNILTIKDQKKSGGIEENKEIQFEIKSAEKWEKWMKNLEIPIVAKKEKESTIYEIDEFRIEINKVKKIGYFLEIETTTDSKIKLKEKKKKLLEWFNFLGFKEKQFDKKYYLEHLKNN